MKPTGLFRTTRLSRGQGKRFIYSNHSGGGGGRGRAIITAFLHLGTPPPPSRARSLGRAAAPGAATPPRTPYLPGRPPPHAAAAQGEPRLSRSSPAATRTRPEAERRGCVRSQRVRRKHDPPPVGDCRDGARRAWAGSGGTGGTSFPLGGGEGDERAGGHRKQSTVKASVKIFIGTYRF